MFQASSGPYKPQWGGGSVYCLFVYSCPDLEKTIDLKEERKHFI